MLKIVQSKGNQQSALSQAVLKHKVRNLRAKIQALLPIDSCQKISKRNHCLKKQLNKYRQMKQQQILSKTFSDQKWKFSYFTNNNMQNKIQKQIRQKQNLNKFYRQIQQSKQSLKMTNKSYLTSVNYTHINTQSSSHKNHNDDQYYYNDINKSNNKFNMNNLKDYHFQKLTDKEIEQIQQDKLYYLGNQIYVHAYEMFIKKKYFTKKKANHNQDEQNNQNIQPNVKNVNRFKNKYSKFIGLQCNNIIDIDQNFINNTKDENNNKLFANDCRCHSSPAQSLTVNCRCKYYQNNKQSNKNIRSSRSFNSNSQISTSNQQNKMSISTSNNNKHHQKSNLSPFVKQNIARINQQQRVKRILLSMTIKTKQQRIEENLNKIQKIKKEQIQKENQKEDFKISYAQYKKRKIDAETGDIIDLAEKLRKKCIQKKTLLFKEKQKDKINKSQRLIMN